MSVPPCSQFLNPQGIDRHSDWYLRQPAKMQVPEVTWEGGGGFQGEAKREAKREVEGSREGGEEPDGGKGF